jgi:flagellar hook-basal body complex protein FliE
MDVPLIAPKTEPPVNLNPTQPSSPAGTDDGTKFEKVLGKVVDAASNDQRAADNSVHDFAVGKNTDIQNTMISLAKADISFQFLLQVRNKIVAAYETVMRMQV